MDPHYERRELQRGTRAISDRYGLGYRVIVDGTIGPATGKYLSGALHYLGLPDSEVKQGVHLDRDDNAANDTVAGWPILTLIDRSSGWLFHSSNYFKGHPGGYVRHTNALKHLRDLRKHPTVNGLPTFDNVAVMPAVYRALHTLRMNGWNGTISDSEYGGCRTRAQQQYLVDHDRPLGAVVADVGTSEHECYRFDREEERGAADITAYDQARRISDKLGMKFQNNVPHDPVHFDFIH